MTNIHRLQDSQIVRIPEQEKKLGIEEMNIYADIEDDILYVTGEIVKAKLKKPVNFTCTVYDDDGDVTDTDPNQHYGDAGWVCNSVKERTYFDGYPFLFRIYLSEGFIPAKIRITCEKCR